jgi:hypothetical protein
MVPQKHSNGIVAESVQPPHHPQHSNALVTSSMRVVKRSVVSAEQRNCRVNFIEPQETAYQNAVRHAMDFEKRSVLYAGSSIVVLRTLSPARTSADEH